MVCCSYNVGEINSYSGTPYWVEHTLMYTDVIVDIRTEQHDGKCPGNLFISDIWQISKYNPESCL